MPFYFKIILLTSIVDLNSFLGISNNATAACRNLVIGTALGALVRMGKTIGMMYFQVWRSNAIYWCISRTNALYYNNAFLRHFNCEQLTFFGLWMAWSTASWEQIKKNFKEHWRDLHRVIRHASEVPNHHIRKSFPTGPCT